jgi:pimeloyl-ACP methyl ester carboxylesterase
MPLHYVRRGTGKPLLLLHGLGSSGRSWSPVLPALAAAERETVAVDLPGHGETPPGPGEATFAGLVEALERFLDAQNLDGVDAVGSSMGGRLVLELARRGRLGATVALGPGGFWEGWERTYLSSTLGAAARIVRLSRPLLPALARNAWSRAALFAQFSAHPGKLPAVLALDEARSLAACPSFDPLLRDLARGPAQAGAPPGGIRRPLAIGWGRRDRVTLPAQAARAARAFPDARLHWFPDCGHFPQWDRPEETVRLVLKTVGR